MTIQNDLILSQAQSIIDRAMALTGDATIARGASSLGSEQPILPLMLACLDASSVHHRAWSDLAEAKDSHDGWGVIAGTLRLAIVEQWQSQLWAARHAVIAVCEVNEGYPRLAAHHMRCAGHAARTS